MGNMLKSYEEGEIVVAKGKVIDGDYKGSYLMYNKKIGIVITAGFLKSVKINEDTIKSYELYDSSKSTSAVSAIGRGAVGSLFLGPIGLLAAVSAKKKGTYVVFIQFTDGKKSLIEFDDEMYRYFKFLPLKGSMVEEKAEEQNIAGSKDDIIGQIKQLSELRDSGILTVEEFESKKSELLAKI